MSTFRKQYRELTPFEKEWVEKIKSGAEQMEMLFDALPLATNMERGRQLALARTKLEEAVMWAVKAATG